MASLPEDQSPARAPVGLHAAEFAAARPVFERAIRVIEAMFGRVAADVVMLVDDTVWRASLVTQIAADRAPSRAGARRRRGGVDRRRAGGKPLARQPDGRRSTLPALLRWRADRPCQRRAHRIVAGLRSARPQPYDERAARALADRAALVAAECARILLQRDLARAEGEARSARETMAAFVEASPASIVMTDSAFRVIRSSPSWRADMRLEGVDVVGRSLQELFPGAMERGWGEACSTALAGEILEHRPRPNPVADGSSFGCRSRSHRGATATGKSRAC